MSDNNDFLKDENMSAKVDEWLKWDKNKETHAAVKKLATNKDNVGLNKIFQYRLNFGTAGLRGPMGPGYNAMNDLVIIQTSQGLATYISSQDTKKRQKVVIGYDGRHNSDRFAKLAALAFMHKGIIVYLYPVITPTPFVPFGILHLGCSAGIMITASHNPKNDNGYKVFWKNGAQIISPHDKNIQECIHQNLEPWLHAWEIDTYLKNDLTAEKFSELESEYYDAMSKNIFDREMNIRCPITFTYTAMHGVGTNYVVRAFNICGFQKFVLVNEQKDPDPEFPTVKFPNPEEGESALDLSFQTAEAHDSSIILANDPDADRLAVAELLPDGKWKIFTGNEIGALLGWWLWFCYKHRNPKATGCYAHMISSTVSSKILKSIAEKEGFNFEETLTGFKWMGNKAYEIIKQKNHEVLFAFEEAIGFMCGTTVLDKDGVNAAMYVAQLAAYASAAGKTLVQQLHEIYNKYGYHVNKSSYFICHSQPKIAAMFERLRKFQDNMYPKKLGPFKINDVRDLTTGYDSTRPDKKAILPSSSSNQMITFYFEEGFVITLRTSGTEPKIKYYTELSLKVDNSKWADMDESIEDIVKLITTEWIQPEVNGFISKEDYIKKE